MFSVFFTKSFLCILCGKSSIERLWNENYKLLGMVFKQFVLNKLSAKNYQNILTSDL